MKLMLKEMNRVFNKDETETVAHKYTYMSGLGIYKLEVFVISSTKNIVVRNEVFRGSYRDIVKSLKKIKGEVK